MAVVFVKPPTTNTFPFCRRVAVCPTRPASMGLLVSQEPARDVCVKNNVTVRATTQFTASIFFERIILISKPPNFMGTIHLGSIHSAIFRGICLNPCHV
jgi:hypothetical protein